MVYRVLADGIDIFGSDTESSLLSPSLETELNSAGSLDFTLPPDHPSYDDISLMQTEIDVYEDDELIFFGRPSEVSIDWNKQKKVSCEGALAYLNDAAIRPHKFEGALISDVFKYIIAQYNAQVAQNKQFIVGNITIIDRYVYTEFDYDICLSVLTSTCIDSTGGYLFLRKEENGIYIDWLAEVPDVSDQPVQFASNMLDLNQDTKAEDICTVVLPIGGQVDGVNITIAPVNQGSDILEDSDAIAKYGRILKIQQWNDIIDPQALKDKATEWLAKQQEDDVTIETDAAELHYLDGSVGAYRIGQLVNVISGPHGVDKEYPILKMSMNLDSGTKKITLGTPPRKELTELSGITNSAGGDSSSGGGGGGGSTGVTDVLVNGSSVVSEHVARISAVTAEQLADGLALKQDQLTPGAGISIDANNVISATGGGGTEVEANPSEPATDDLNTIKIGETVYDIPGGGSATNYGKFKCDVLFNTPDTSTSFNDPVIICSEEKAKEYDMLHFVTYTYSGRVMVENVLVSDIKQQSDNYYILSPRTDQNVNGYEYFTYIAYSNGNLVLYGATNKTITVEKVYGLKFENKAINRSDIYSEEERMIGRWTDGKPLYQKTIKNIGVTLQQNTWTNTGISFTGIDHWEVILNKSNSSNYDNQYPMLYRFNNGNFQAFCQYTIPLDELTLQYTKTTDAPGSGVLPEDPQMVMMSDYYSEDEQVVGRWTDGKPLYQKSIRINNLNNNSWNDTDIVLNDADIVLVYDSVIIDYSNSTPSWCYSVGNAGGSGEYRSQVWVNPATKKLQIWISRPSMQRADALVTLRYTKTTDTPGTGPTKGNLIYLPALYSEEEREVGVWTDGKPLYQKTYDLGSATAFPNNTWTTVISNVTIPFDEVIKCEGVQADPAAVSFDIWFDSSSNALKARSLRDGNESVRYITVQYTKTTDQPGSGTWTPEGQLAHHYSTSEKIVGTWIDGSTVYERTWDFSANPISLPYDTWVNTTIQSSDGVSNIISAECLTSSFLVMDGNEIMVGAANYPVGICAKINHGRSLGYLTLQYTKT